jgi:hypothetical protein
VRRQRLERLAGEALNMCIVVLRWDQGGMWELGGAVTQQMLQSEWCLARCTYLVPARDEAVGAQQALTRWACRSPRQLLVWPHQQYGAVLVGAVHALRSRDRTLYVELRVALRVARYAGVCVSFSVHPLCA